MPRATIAPSLQPSAAPLALATALALCYVAPRPAAAQGAGRVADAAGDFLSTYTGPRNADLDVVSAEFTYDNRGTFRLASTSAGAIGTTPGAPFVWGVDRGRGVPAFAQLGLPNIRFDAVVALIPGGTSVFVDVLTGALTPLAAGSVRYSGNTIEAFVPLSLLAPQGFAPAQYTANVWPRSAPVLNDDSVISDFAPDDRNIAVAVTPEPSTIALAGAGALALLGTMRRRGRSGEVGTRDGARGDATVA